MLNNINPGNLSILAHPDIAGGGVYSAGCAPDVRDIFHIVQSYESICVFSGFFLCFFGHKKLLIVSYYA